MTIFIDGKLRCNAMRWKHLKYLRLRRRNWVSEPSTQNTATSDCFTSWSPRRYLRLAQIINAHHLTDDLVVASWDQRRKINFWFCHILWSCLQESFRRRRFFLGAIWWMIAIFSRVCCCVKSDIRTMWSWILNKFTGSMRNWFRWKKVVSQIATEADVKIISVLSCPPRFHPSRCAAQRSGRRFSPLAFALLQSQSLIRSGWSRNLMARADRIWFVCASHRLETVTWINLDQRIQRFIGSKFVVFQVEGSRLSSMAEHEALEANHILLSTCPFHYFGAATSALNSNRRRDHPRRSRSMPMSCCCCWLFEKRSRNQNL